MGWIVEPMRGVKIKLRNEPGNHVHLGRRLLCSAGDYALRSVLILCRFVSVPEGRAWGFRVAKYMKFSDIKDIKDKINPILALVGHIAPCIDEDTWYGGR